MWQPTDAERFLNYSSELLLGISKRGNEAQFVLCLLKLNNNNAGTKMPPKCKLSGMEQGIPCVKAYNSAHVWTPQSSVNFMIVWGSCLKSTFERRLLVWLRSQFCLSCSKCKWSSSWLDQPSLRWQIFKSIDVFPALEYTFTLEICIKSKPFDYIPESLLITTLTTTINYYTFLYFWIPTYFFPNTTWRNFCV